MINKHLTIVAMSLYRILLKQNKMYHTMKQCNIAWIWMEHWLMKIAQMMYVNFFIYLELHKFNSTRSRDTLDLIWVLLCSQLIGGLTQVMEFVRQFQTQEIFKRESVSRKMKIWLSSGNLCVSLVKVENKKKCKLFRFSFHRFEMSKWPKKFSSIIKNWTREMHLWVYK